MKRLDIKEILEGPKVNGLYANVVSADGEVIVNPDAGIFPTESSALDPLRKNTTARGTESLDDEDIPPEFAGPDSARHLVWRAQQLAVTAMRNTQASAASQPNDSADEDPWASLGYSRGGNIPVPACQSPGIAKKLTIAKQNAAERDFRRRAREDRYGK